jgi:putative tricarboxylic transport membrane protein
VSGPAARPVPRLNAETVPALLWLALGAFLVVQGRELGIGGITEPGSGFVVFWGGVLVCGFAGSLAVAGFRARAAPIGRAWEGTRRGPVLAVVAALVLYAALLGPLGFLLATFPLMLALLRVVDPVPWRLAVPVAAGATLGVWWVIERLLLVQLPKGLVELG